MGTDPYMTLTTYRHWRNQSRSAYSFRNAEVSVCSKSSFISTETAARPCSSIKTRNLSASFSNGSHSSSSGIYQQSSLQSLRKSASSASVRFSSCFLNQEGLSTSLAVISTSSDFFQVEFTLICMLFAMSSRSFLLKALKNCLWVRRTGVFSSDRSCRLSRCFSPCSCSNFICCFSSSICLSSSARSVNSSAIFVSV